MSEPIEFRAFPKIARFNRDIVVTEKIDGTNACVVIDDYGKIAAQSRNKIIEPGKKTDNMGFAGWVRDNHNDLLTLGPGYHFGEWWGAGIQRGYGLPKGEKRFSLFNVHRWGATANPDDRLARPPCCLVVPVLYQGPMSQGMIGDAVDYLRKHGSRAAPGFMDPEGIIVFHSAASQLFKITLKDDGEPKSVVAARAA